METAKPCAATVQCLQTALAVMAKLEIETVAVRSVLRNRLRSDGVLTPDELAYCRAYDIPLGYDCAQVGWVPLDCIDDFDDAWHDATGANASAPARFDLDDIKRELEADLRALAHSVELDVLACARKLATARLVDLSGAVGDVEQLDEYHLALERWLTDRLVPDDHALGTGRSDSGTFVAAFEYRPWRQTDAPSYRGVFDDERVWSQLPDGYPGPFDEQLARQLIELSNLGDHHEVRAVEYRGTAVGQVRLMFNRRYRQARVAEVAYVLRPELWGHGLMTPILSDFTERSFRRHDLDFIVAWIRPDNTASLRTAEHAGYRRDDFPMERELAQRVGRPGFVRYVRSLRPIEPISPSGQSRRAS